ncbi:MAG: hypothetical protein ACRYFW_07705 [Janthinobacterium lividum]
MLGSIRPIASLSSGLLARKGQARPAMRPQGFGAAGATPSSADDLGWNDMGEPDPPEAHADLPPVLVERSALQQEVTRLAPPPEAATVEELAPLAEPSAPSLDEVFSAPAPEPAPVASKVSADNRSVKAAFTLRLPGDRHLRLRLAAAVTHRSAQAIVTEALDAFLSTLPEVEELAHRCSVPDRLGTQA